MTEAVLGGAGGTLRPRAVYQWPVVVRARTDEELVESARGGDVGAYEELVARYQQLAFRAAYVVCGSAADAEEAAQDAFVKAFGALGRFRRGSPLRPWLLSIVANEARNRRRSAGRREHLAARAAREPAPVFAPSAEATALASEARAVVLHGLSRLPERDRQVIACRYLLDLGEEETAAVLGWRRGTVKSRLARALERLRSQLPAEVRSA